MKIVTAICLTLSVARGNIRAAETPPAKPNIIVIFTDDQTYRGIGYNNLEVKTPHLDTLAASGITFEHAYVASPICAASRSSMMTGRFPEQHGVRALDTKAFAPYLKGAPHANQTLPSRLNEAGYTTTLLGKSQLGEPQTYGFAAGNEIGFAEETLPPRQIEFKEKTTL